MPSPEIDFVLIVQPVPPLDYYHRVKNYSESFGLMRTPITGRPFTTHDPKGVFDIPVPFIPFLRTSCKSHVIQIYD